MQQAVLALVAMLAMGQDRPAVSFEDLVIVTLPGESAPSPGMTIGSERL